MKASTILLAFALYSALAAVRAAEPAAETATELAVLKSELARLAARITELEARLAAAPPTQPALANPRAEPPATAAVAATATVIDAPAPAPPAEATSPRRSVEIGGRVKVDAVFSHTGNVNGDSNNTLLIPGAIALDEDGEQDQVDFSTRASRIWLKHWQATSYGDAGAYIELDLLGSGGDQRVSNGYGVRLRHAYAELGHFLFGQTYSTFVNVGALPEHNDDGIAAGALSVRQTQLRWRGALGSGEFSAALETAETTLSDRTGVRLTPDDDRLPDVVLRYDRRGLWGSWSIATLVRELRIDLDEKRSTEDSAAGFAINAAGQLPLGVNDALRFSAVGGNAVGRYLSWNAFEGGRLRDHRIELPLAAGGFLSWQHFWTERWRSNLTGGYAWRSADDGWDEENTRIATLHANLLWNPVTTTTVGLEWILAHRERVDGQRGELQRLQFTAIHKF